MNMRLFIFLFGVLLATHCSAQDAVLTNYLLSHRIALKADSNKLMPSKEFTDLLRQKMAGKKLLIYGEGGSHSLNLNGKMWILLMSYMAGNNLRYYFSEGARAWAMENNEYLASGIPAYDHPVYKTWGGRYTKMKEQERYIYQHTGKYKNIGIDFERPSTTYEQINLLKNKNAVTLGKIYAILPQLKDSS